MTYEPCTPTIGDLAAKCIHNDQSLTISPEEFARAIASIQADAIVNMANTMRDRFTAAWLRGQAHKIRTQETEATK